MRTDELISSKDKCSACGACKNICPSNAIEYITDTRGFLFPHINEEKCVNCKSCIKVCPFRGELQKKNTEFDVFAIVNKNTDLLLKSASGGAFSALASWALKNDYIVYGCSWNKDMYPVHIGITDENELKKIQGSKYVQSDTGSVFSEIKKDLSNGKKVIFSGTPCQCEGLRNFIGYDSENLICIELICHGVPNATIFHEYVDLLEKQLNGKIVNIQFRDKKRGWGSLLHVEYINSKGQHKDSYYSTEESFYYYFFKAGYMYRESCYNCKFACAFRQSDLTLGDFWGIQAAHPNIDSTFGVSVVISNSSKGKTLLEKVSDQLIIVPSKLDYAQKENGQLLSHPKYSKNNDTIWNIYKKNGIEGLQRYYLSNNKKNVLIGKLKRMMPLKFKKIIRLLLK